MSEVVSLEPSRKKASQNDECIRIVGNAYQHKLADNHFFNRQELNAILQVYSRHVMAGEWLDYAIGHLPDGGGVFEIYGQAAAHPIYRVFKHAKSQQRQGRYQVADRLRVLKTSKQLDTVLKVIDRRKPKLVQDT